MNAKDAKDENLVAQYKSAALLRLAELKAKNNKPFAHADKSGGMTLTVRFAHNAKPLSAFGGVAEVLGPSRIRIPDYKLDRN